MKLRIVGFLLVEVDPELDDVDEEAELLELVVEEPPELEPPELDPLVFVAPDEPLLAAELLELLVVVGVVAAEDVVAVDWDDPLPDPPDPLVEPLELLPPTRPINAST